MHARVNSCREHDQQYEANSKGVNQLSKARGEVNGSKVLPMRCAAAAYVAWRPSAAPRAWPARRG